MGSSALSAPASARAGSTIALRVTGVSKTFPGTRALDTVDLEVRRGEIHALIGNNGSGKSTLIKILAGVCAADPGGTIEIGGRSEVAHTWSPERARAAGLHFVHQVPAVFAVLSVAENLAIGRGFETGRARRIDWRAQRIRAQKLIERFQIRALPDTPVGVLAPADRTLVAIARALQDQEGRHDGVLVLDEPTASLPAREVARLLEALRGHAALGQAILYVSHHLDEVLQASHRVSALRDGRRVDTVDTPGMSEAELVALMLGHAAPARETVSVHRDGVELLSVSELRGGFVESVGFALQRGEILGLAGLVGSGASDVLRMLFGALPRSAGNVSFDGAPYTARSPSEAMRAGVAYLPAERAFEASFADMHVRHNLLATKVAQYFRGLRLRHDAERADARSLIERFEIRVASEEQPLSTLSGGNQQKVVLARWLCRDPKLLLLDEPTPGVDVHSRAEIHGFLRQAAGRGAAAIVVSSDFSELVELCDRVLVLARGRVVHSLARSELDSHRLTELAHFAPEAS